MEHGDNGQMTQGQSPFRARADLLAARQKVKARQNSADYTPAANNTIIHLEGNTSVSVLLIMSHGTIEC